MARIVERPQARRELEAIAVHLLRYARQCCAVLIPHGECRPADGEAVLARKDQVQRPAVAAHLLHRETARLAGADELKALLQE